MSDNVVSIPLSGNVIDEPGSARGLRRQACTLREFVSGPENRLAVTLFNSYLGISTRGGSTPRPARALAARTSNIDVQEFADATAATAVAEPPDDDEYDLALPPALSIICGAPGTGKTHLAFGLAEWWKRHRPSQRVVYLHAGDFWRELHDAFDQRTADLWREPLRSADLLVIEDVGQLATRTTAQIELLHTLDAVADRGGHVMLTSRMRPAQMPTLLPGLQSRLAEGVLVELAPPSLATRRAVLRRLAQARRTAASEPVLRTLAEGVAGTVPELFGALLYLESEASVEQRPISLAMAQRYVARRSRGPSPTLRGIAQQTARHFALKISELKSPSRRRTVVLARDVAMYLARQLTGKSLEQIGAYFGGRDHTTVLHGCRKTESLVETDASTRQTVNTLKARVATCNP